MGLLERVKEAKKIVDESLQHKSRGMVTNQVIGTIMMVIIVGALIIVGYIFYGFLGTSAGGIIGSTTSNTYNNTTAAITSIVNLLNQVLSIFGLIVILVLLFLAVGVMMMLGQFGGQAKRGRR